MEYSAVFIKARAIAFSLVAFISFTWTVLLCVVLTLQWDVMDKPEKSFVAVMIVLNVLTMFLLLILLVLRFRPWLDGARCLFVLAAHITTAAWFLSWSPKFRCETGNLDKEGTCGLLIVYMVLASWVIPTLVLLYLGGLVLMIRRRSNLPKANQIVSDDQDLEKRSSGSSTQRHDSFLPAGSQHSNHDQSLDPFRRLTILPPTMAQGGMTRDRMSDGSRSQSFSSTTRQSYNTRSSVPLRMSQPMMDGLPKVNEQFNVTSTGSWTHQSRLTLPLPFPPERTSQGPLPAQSTTLAKSAPKLY
ncbi:hypothetical protein E1B28_008722 [Marasmius oreades]|uniref:Uncharacterized protein n=1 Tax=Marasmius oreades TaxID=181124 RepID=A0A9P7RZI4_9AGAR|nr:uncharacterized protein E1B28_008722 [Marasmius oreades]KAG7092363.1 hypothetical protein E1B28_008722 [Marasmius oreades]